MLAEMMAECDRRKGEFEDALIDAGFGGFGKWWSDDYDNSVEFSNVGNGTRLNKTAQGIIYDAGFSLVFVTHADGWETMYTLDRSKPFIEVKGWRRKTTKTGFLVSDWPERWGDPETGKCAGWLKSGYITIIPDTIP